jgi:hypothetical protein
MIEIDSVLKRRIEAIQEMPPILSAEERMQYSLDHVVVGSHISIGKEVFKISDILEYRGKHEHRRTKFKLYSLNTGETYYFYSRSDEEDMAYLGEDILDTGKIKTLQKGKETVVDLLDMGKIDFECRGEIIYLDKVYFYKDSEGALICRENDEPKFCYWYEFSNQRKDKIIIAEEREEGNELYFSIASKINIGNIGILAL